MRIVWYSALGPTGYGTQTDLFTRYLSEQGHDLVIAAYHLGNHLGADVNGVPIVPPPLVPDSSAILPRICRQHKAELVIVLADFWTMNPAMLAKLPCPVAAWIPLDTEPMSMLDFAVLKRSGVTPVAMSQFGRNLLERAGWAEPLYVPHAIDAEAWRAPLAGVDRGQIRAAFSLDDDFRVGLNFNNLDPWRKAAPVQIAAFARFHQKHPQSSLWVHTITPVKNSLDILVLAKTEKIDHAVHLSDQEMMQAGEFTQPDMARWYAQLDVFMNATAGEGFGLPGIEAQACGTPVILARNTTGPELAGPGWLAECDWPGQWNYNHQSWWKPPRGPSLLKCLEASIKQGPFKRQASRAWAEKWDISIAGPMWDAALERLAS